MLLLQEAESRPARPADKSPHTSGLIRANGIRQHYLDWGGKGEALLLLAGFGNNAHVFDEFAPKFTDRFHVLGLTRRGFGKSDKPEGGYDTTIRVEDIRRFLDALKIKRVSLIGHSMAGDELTLFATRYPQRVRKLVYLDAAYNRIGVGRMSLTDPGIPPIWKRLELEAQDSPEAAKIVIDKKEMPPPDVWAIRVAYVKAMNRYRPDYKKMQAPALAFYAMPEHYPEVPPETDEATRRQWDEWHVKNIIPYTRRSIEQFQREAPHGQAILLKNAKHYLFEGKTAAQVIRQTREFLLK